jgi:hypothetical protein
MGKREHGEWKIKTGFVVDFEIPDRQHDES